MPSEALLDAIAETVFGYLLQEADLAGHVRTVPNVNPAAQGLPDRAEM